MDERGVYFPDNISGPNFGQYRYDVIHPITGKVCKEPSSGWRFPESTMLQRIKDNLVHFGKDETTVPNNKTFLKDTEYQSLTSVKYRDGRVASKNLNELLGGKYFTNPKDPELLTQLLKATKVKSDDIVLDFFAGSGSTGQAVIDFNKENGGSTEFVLVQLPEPCDESSEAYKAGFKTIADISKERIRRVIQNIKKEKAEKPDLFENKNLDLGFKAFKLSSSNFKIWRGINIKKQNDGLSIAAEPDAGYKGNEEENDLIEQLEMFTDPVKPGSLKDNMFYELLLKAGYQLTDKIEKRLLFYSVKDNELIIALEMMSREMVEVITKSLPKPKKVITLDILFANNDQLKTNTVLQMKDAGIDFKTI